MGIYTKRSPDELPKIKKKRTHSMITKDRLKEIKRVLVIEAGGKCFRCGYDKIKYLPVFEFHHKDPGAKEFELSRMIGCTSLENLQKETAKCDLYCANCHRELHFELNEEKIKAKMKPINEKRERQERITEERLRARTCLSVHCKNPIYYRRFYDTPEGYCCRECSDEAGLKEPKPNKEKLEKEINEILVTGGFPCYVLAEKYGTHRVSIANWAKKYGIHYRQRKEHKNLDGTYKRKEKALTPVSSGV